MSSYHKPKIFRSVEGCCICKAKSSSSRFTDSEKYESEFSNCFLLDEAREGDICNACVLVVKRWKILPKDTKKNWAHVVDARNGPGNKHITKLKKKDDEIEKFEKIRKKRKNKISSRKLFVSCQDPTAEKKISSNDFDVPDFVDLTYWKRSVICCGVIYKGKYGEIMLDQRFFKKCEQHSTSRPTVSKPIHESVKCSEDVEDVFEDSDTRSYDGDSDSLSFYSDSESSFSKLSHMEMTPHVDTDTGDEGFYDKSDIRHLT